VNCRIPTEKELTIERKEFRRRGVWGVEGGGGRRRAEEGDLLGLHR